MTNTEMLQFLEDIAKKHGYKQLPLDLSQQYRKMYLDHIPNSLKISGNDLTVIKDINGYVIANGYDRIVIGDYSAYLEISPNQIVQRNLFLKIGQEYRVHDPKYADKVKYVWYTTTSFCHL